MPALWRGTVTLAPHAIAASKMAVNAYLRSVSADHAERLNAERLTMQTEIIGEAVLAFQEKRPARFR
jgi:hypothetical protein